MWAEEFVEVADQKKLNLSVYLGLWEIQYFKITQGARLLSLELLTKAYGDFFECHSALMILTENYLRRGEMILSPVKLGKQIRQANRILKPVLYPAGINNLKSLHSLVMKAADDSAVFYPLIQSRSSEAVLEVSTSLP
ncbi:MAG: hypothetical protein NTV32_01370 [Gammaproteobacteria bacterium]|nr:hypothetical protein [Gammaproteobacteria bacterium]